MPSFLSSAIVMPCAAAGFGFSRRKVPVPLVFVLTSGKEKTVGDPSTLETGGTASTARPGAPAAAKPVERPAWPTPGNLRQESAIAGGENGAIQCGRHIN